MGDPAVERQPAVVPVVDSIPRIVGVGGPCADLDAGGEALCAVGAERSPELGVVVRDRVGVAWPAGPQVVAAVVSDDGDVAGGGIQRDLRQELAVGGLVV